MLIVHPRDPVLRRAASSVETFDRALSETIDMLAEAMYANAGVGIAAPQVNVGQRIAIIDPSGGYDTNQMMVLINPEVTWVSTETASGEEGCLSLPGVRLYVDRPVALDVEYSLVDGSRRSARLTGEGARIAQHEVDHLDGIMMIDRVGSLTRRLGLRGHR